MSSDSSATPIASSSSTNRSGPGSSSSSSNGSTQTSNSNERMVPTKVWTKQEYVDLLPQFSKSDFERLKKSIKEHGGLLMPIILNQDNVVLDGHHRMRACKELGYRVAYNIKDFTGKPMEELRYVIAVNLHRRHLSQFERAEMGVKMYNIDGTIAKQRQRASRFTTETGKAATVKRFHGGGDIASEKPLRSLDAEDSDDEDEEKDLTPLRSSQEIGDKVDVSHTTIERVKTIIEDGTPE
ncbi:MAG: ParB N-terminal domain-containing protein [Candidatus Nitrosopolaris sp.]